MRSTVHAADRLKVGDHVTIYKRGRYWWEEFYFDGRQQRRSLKTTSAKQARLLAARTDRDLSLGEYDTSGKTCTIQEAIKAYLMHLATENRAASTLARYRSELERFETFARSHRAARLDQITIRLLEEFRAQRTHIVKPKTLYHETVVVKQLVRYAVSRRLLKSNPLAELEVRKPKAPHRRAYTLHEVQEILRVAKEPWRLMFEVLAFSGLRIGELQHLSWNDVDLNGGWLHVRSKPDVGWRPKNGEDRKVPIHERVQSALKRLPHVGRWVFWQRRTIRGQVHVEPIDARRVLKELRATAARVGIGDATVHAFRHFFITFAADRGVQPLQLMRWVGHRDLSVILGYYHLGDAESQRGMQSLSSATGAGRDEIVQQQAQNKDNFHEQDAA